MNGLPAKPSDSLLADTQRRDDWLAAKASDPHTHLVFVGKNVTVADAERWLREALGV